MLQQIQWQQQTYWRHAKIQDNLIRDTFKKIFHNLFVFVPKFPDFIFKSWTLFLRKGQDNLSTSNMENKDNNDEAKPGSDTEEYANK